MNTEGIRGSPASFLGVSQQISVRNSDTTLCSYVFLSSSNENFACYYAQNLVTSLFIEF